MIKKIIDISKRKLYYFDTYDKNTIYIAKNGEYQYISTIIGNEEKLEEQKELFMELRSIF